MLKIIFVTARDRKRLTEISSVLVRHGLQDIIRFLGLSEPVGKSSSPSFRTDISLPERLCAALEELGPTFIKLGQILASRSDLLGPEWTTALSRLHSSATPLPWNVVEPIMLHSLGTELENVFSWWDTTPLAAASIGQVHRARLKNGKEVVVKVQRPGLDKKLRADLRLLRFLAESIEQQNPRLARFRPVQLVLFLDTALTQELDFCYEAANAETAMAQFNDDADVIIPMIYKDWSSSTLLVQDFLEGVSPTRVSSAKPNEYDGPHVAQVGAKAFMKMVFEYRFYHADPHPGNVMVLSGNKVGFIDFGMVGHLSESRCNELLSFLYAISESESSGIVDALIGWSHADELDVAELELAAAFFLDRQGCVPLQLGKALADIFTTAREFQLTLPPDLVLLFKALITAEGVLQRLDPKFDIVKTLRPMLRKHLFSRGRAFFSQRSLIKLGHQFGHSATALPQTLRLVLKRLQHGRVKADISLTNLDKLGVALERAAITLAVAIITAVLALVLGAWMILTDLRLAGIPLLPIISSSGVFVGIAWLIWRLRGR
ncbi:AarF/UbiB family protein [Pectobacterium betavasculorum]|uniref:ABC transporter n=1 Tax=Pectobacterium betavasculorum TaxID=55207 RepID=A0ABR4UWI5_9GAMM|nr:AarF/UbiB family protein [Pectobacterium betavasculorum]KFX19135.1 ABC transporter [Pectobacterium betavasculorum]